MAPPVFKKWAQIFLDLILLGVLAPLILGYSDYALIRAGLSPIFTSKFGGIFDDGTFYGKGLGYTVYRHHGQLYAALKGQAWEKADWAEGACLQFRFWPYSFFDVENIRISPQAPENPVAPSEEKTALALDLKALDSVDGWVSDEVVLRGRKVRLFFELFAPEEDSPSIDGALGVNIGIATDAILGSYEQIVKEGQRGLIFTLMESDKKISFSYELKDDVLTLVLQEANWPHFGKISGAYKFHQRKP